MLLAVIELCIVNAQHVGQHHHAFCHQHGMMVTTAISVRGAALMTQGYILYSLRKKLKAELVGKSQEEIKELRLAGQEVTDTYQVDTIAFHIGPAPVAGQIRCS